MAEELPPHYLLLLLNDARRIRGGRGRLEEALFGALEGGEKTVCRERLRRKKKKEEIKINIKVVHLSFWVSHRICFGQQEGR